MIKRSVNMVHVNYLQGNSIFLPYAAGTLVAYAQCNPEVNNYYSFENLFFLREDTDALAEKLKFSALVGFSNYIWNYEFNKVLAKKIKQRNPDSIIVFGGHNINPDGSLLDECQFIDYLIHGEGEEIFVRLLLSLARNMDLHSIPNISYRINLKTINTPLEPVYGDDYISPYLSGCFDNILSEHPDIDFQAIIETSRGCPYNCSFCDWGNLNSKVRAFPIDKLYAELDWLCCRKIKFIAGADANFGILERDEAIIDKMIELHNSTGYPENFQTSYAKKSNDMIFRMTKKLNDCGMNKGVTISFQSLSDIVLKNIRRNNISIRNYSALMKKYNTYNISTYTELIIGLPGETFNSFISGIDILLNAGQHNLIYFHNCEWLPCSEMERKEYVEKFKIQTSLIPINLPHREQTANDEIKEFSKIVTSTYSMSSDDWIKMNLFSIVIQCFHFGGFLQVFAIYLHHEKYIKYSDFFISLLDFVLSVEHPVSFSIFSKIKSKLDDVICSVGELTCMDERFGNLIWSLDEYAYLLLAVNLKSFYGEIMGFLQRFDIEKDIFESLITYQQNIIKLPFEQNNSFFTEYDVKFYFENLLKGDSVSLKKIRSFYTIESQAAYSSWSEYAKYVVWYGKKDNKNFYTTEVHIHFQDSIE